MHADAVRREREIGDREPEETVWAADRLVSFDDRTVYLVRAVGRGPVDVSTLEVIDTSTGGVHLIAGWVPQITLLVVQRRPFLENGAVCDMCSGTWRPEIMPDWKSPWAPMPSTVGT
jgi:hypothetical protein